MEYIGDSLVVSSHADMLRIITGYIDSEQSEWDWGSKIYQSAINLNRLCMREPARFIDNYRFSADLYINGLLVELKISRLVGQVLKKQVTRLQAIAEGINVQHLALADSQKILLWQVHAPPVEYLLANDAESRTKWLLDNRQRARFPTSDILLDLATPANFIRGKTDIAWNMDKPL